MFSYNHKSSKAKQIQSKCVLTCRNKLLPLLWQRFELNNQHYLIQQATDRNVQGRLLNLSTMLPYQAGI